MKVDAASSGQNICSEDKHPDGCAEHQKRCHADDYATDHRARLVLHDRAIAGDDQDADQQERCEQAVEDRRPVESLNRANVKEVECDADSHRGDEHGVEARGAREVFIESLPPRESFGKGICGGSGKCRDGEKAGANDACREKNCRFASHRFCGA
jgi:hypothetical protein